jgi:retron-type reverse transcriptase
MPAGMDRELEGRGLALSRYADDCNIYVSSQRAAERVLASITEWIKKHLRLEVNATKSGVGRPEASVSKLPTPPAIGYSGRNQSLRLW